MNLLANCKEAHRLTSEGMDRNLTLAERSRVRAHLLVCAGCRNFDQQMRLVRRAMHAFAVPDADDTETR